MMLLLFLVWLIYLNNSWEKKPYKFFVFFKHAPVTFVIVCIFLFPLLFFSRVGFGSLCSNSWLMLGGIILWIDSLHRFSFIPRVCVCVYIYIYTCAYIGVYTYTYICILFLDVSGLCSNLLSFLLRCGTYDWGHPMRFKCVWTLYFLSGCPSTRKTFYIYIWGR